MTFASMSGFYAGVFYPAGSPLYDPSEDRFVYDSCFAAPGQTSLYHGLLFQTAELREDYYLYA